MVFCSTSNSSGIIINGSNYNTPYVTALAAQTPSVTVKSCLSTGTSLATIGVPPIPISDLLTTFGATPPSAEIIESNSADPTGAYATASDRLRSAINNEYCYYYKCYDFALPTFLKSTITNPSTNTQLETDCKDINRILSQILQILSDLAASRGTSVTGYYTAVDLMNGTAAGEKAGTAAGEIVDVQAKLTKHMALLTSNSKDADLKAAMIDYTMEKNSASRNMIAIYGFLNIVAVGMLVYLYRSSK